MSPKADVVVIGGGSTGTSTAYHLAKKGAGKVVLLEKEFIAYGATGKSVAVVRQHYTIETLAKMAKRSLMVFQRFKELVGGEAGFINTGLLVAVRDADVEAFNKAVSMHKRIGIDTKIIDGREASELMPGLEPEGLVAIAYEPEAGYADSSLVAVSYANAASEYGAEVYTKTKAERIVVEEGRVKGVKTTRGEIECESILVAANVWSPAILKPLGIKVPIRAIREQVCLFKRPPESSEAHPILFSFVDDFYMRSEKGRVSILGSMGLTKEGEQIDPDNYNQSVDYEFVLEIGSRVSKRFKPLENSTLYGGWAGPYDVSPDYQPILDEAPNIKGLYMAVGLSGHGFKLAPAFGEMLSELILRGKKPTDEIALFSYSRFDEGRLIKPEYGLGIVG